MKWEHAILVTILFVGTTFNVMRTNQHKTKTTEPTQTTQSVQIKEMAVTAGH